MEKETQTDELPGAMAENLQVIRKQKESILKELVALLPVELCTWPDQRIGRTTHLWWSIVKALVLCEVLALIKTCVALTFISLEELCNKPELALASNATKHIHHVNHILNLTLDKPVIDVILGLILVIGGLWMVFSAMLILGILKSNSTHVMAYFLFGCAVCIIFFLSSLLEVVNGMWVPSVITMTLTTIYVRCLMFVYNAYDNLLQEKTLGDRDQLLFEEEFSIDE